MFPRKKHSVKAWELQTAEMAGLETAFHPSVNPGAKDDEKPDAEL